MFKRTLLTAAMLAGAVTLGACGDSSTPAPSNSSGGTSGDAAKKAAEMTSTIKKEGDKASADMAKAAGLTEDAKAQAEKLLDQAKTYISDNKLDLAEKAVGELETLKPQMTPEWQGRVENVRTALDTAKKTGMLKNGSGVPKMGG